MDDIRAVMDAVGSERAVLFGLADGGALACCLPPRTRSGRLRSSSTRRAALYEGAELPLGADA